MKPIRTLLVAVDFSEPSARALEYACELAGALGARIHLVHAYQAPLLEVTPYHVAIPQGVFEAARNAANDQLEALRLKLAKQGTETQAHLREGSAPPDAIADAAEEIGADLIVIGTHGHTGLKHALLGSVAERTLRLARCPVLTVGPRDDE